MSKYRWWRKSEDGQPAVKQCDACDCSVPVTEIQHSDVFFYRCEFCDTTQVGQCILKIGRRIQTEDAYVAEYDRYVVLRSIASATNHLKKVLGCFPQVDFLEAPVAKS